AKGIAVISFAGSQDWVYNSCLVSTLVGRFTGDANWVKDTVDGKHKFTDKGFVDALAFMKKMFDDGVISPASVQNDYGASLAQFLAGKALFTLDGDWRAGGMGDGFEVNVKLLNLPALPGEKLANSSSVVGATGYGMTTQALRDPKVADAAKKFIDFYNSEAQATLRLTGGVATTSLVSLSKNPPADTPLLMKARLALTASVVPVNVMDNFIPEQAMTPFATGMVQIVLGKATPAQVAADLEKNTRAALAAK
ncbi:MAG TPA: extracellular solute-binding protein, partial [Spirochaetia bacterium]|nr:extracellular solute-binding protein [Spirochaetia bacterium]